MASVSAVGVRALLSALQRLGLQPELLLAEVGLDGAPVSDPDGHLDAAKADALWASAYRRTGDDLLALRAAEQLRAGDYRSLSYLAAHCATLGEGVRRILGYFDLVDRRLQWSLHDDLDPVVLRLQLAGLADPLPRPPVEYTLGAFVVTLRHATGLDWRPLRVEVGFAHPGALAAAEHERVLGPMRYGCDATRLVIAGHWWRHPVATADRDMADLLEELAARRVREVPAEHDLRGRLHQTIGAELVGGPPSLSETALALAMSPRSLQRALAELGTSFRDEIDGVRRSTAEFLLHDPLLALTEISWLLGFSDPRAFTRAFRRWHGITPSVWRSSPAGTSVE